MRGGIAVASLVLLFGCSRAPSVGPDADPTDPPGDAQVDEAREVDEAWTYTASSGEVVEFPAPSNAVTVGAGVGENLPLNTIDGIEWMTSTVVTNVGPADAWSADDVMTIRWPDSQLPAGALTAQNGGWGERLTAVVTVVSQKTGEAYTAYAEAVHSMLDKGLEVQVALVDAYTSDVLDDVEIYVRVAKNVARQFKPVQEGLFFVKDHLIPSLAELDTLGCEENLLFDEGLLSHLPASEFAKDDDTALVMVHGWQTLAGIVKGQAGDTYNLNPHCSNWLPLMAATEHMDGVWADVREEVDLFTFRYDSDLRISRSGDVLNDALDMLRDDFGYASVVLVGHSMGGLVSVDARSKLEQEKADFVSGIVTLGTPFMGSILLCTETDGGYCSKAAPFAETASLTSAGEDAMHFLLPDLALAHPLGGTLDLSTYYGVLPGSNLFERNPYLEALWSDTNNFTRVFAFYGSNEGRFEASAMYEGLSAVIRDGGWGYNDGIVPEASATGSASLRFPTAQIQNVASYGRDHGQLNMGCPDCWDGGSMPHYDAYFDGVAQAILGFVNAATISGTITDLPGGSWRVMPYDLLGDRFLDAGAPVAGGRFELDLAPIERTLTLGTVEAPPGVTISPEDAMLGQATLLVFDDVDGDHAFDVGEEAVHRVNDPANTFATDDDKFINLWYADRAYVFEGTADDALTTRFDIDAPAGWQRWTYASGGGGADVAVRNASQMIALELAIGEPLSLVSNDEPPFRTVHDGVPHPSTRIP